MNIDRARRQGISVLCIEDEEELRLDLMEELEDAGFTVTGADSGESGLNLLAVNTFTIVLCDVRLPGISGIDVLTSIRQPMARNDVTPFVVLSAYDDQLLRRKLEAAGASAFLVKPVDYRHLIRQILVLVGAQA